MAKSYMVDLFKQNDAFILTISKPDLKKNKFLNEKLQIGSKIISSTIPSRHRRGRDSNSKFKNNYKIFIMYKPSVNSTSSIQAYICSCLSGRKAVGACSHVAALILYLSNAKYNILRTPGEYLVDIFPDFQQMEESNMPKYVKNYRFPEDDSSNEEEATTSEQDSDSYAPSSSTEDEDELDFFVQKLKDNIPRWGANINYNGKLIKVTNTCSIDYMLLTLWLAQQLDNNFVRNIPDLIHHKSPS